MKTLHIQECYFELPDDFDGSLGDALTLMTNRVLQCEIYKEVYDKVVYNMRDYFMNERKGKCVIAYEIFDTTKIEN